MSQPATFGSPRGDAAPLDPDVYADFVADSFEAVLSAHSGAARPAYAVEGTIWWDTDEILQIYDGAADRAVAVNAGAPASASAAGVVGQVAWDADYFYVCTDVDEWKRAALSTW